jgi:hypothetical protein
VAVAFLWLSPLRTLRTAAILAPEQALLPASELPLAE